MSLSSSSSTADESTSVGLCDIRMANDETLENDEDALLSWRTRINSSIKKSRRIRGGNYVQLATVDPQTHEPRCRTVVFRGFQPIMEHQTTDESCVLKMITDARSLKVTEVGTDSNILTSDKCTAELVWWFSQSSEQYRIRGKLQPIYHDSNDPFLNMARIEQWGNLSESAREQFYWSSPGAPFQSKDLIIPKGGRDEAGKILPAPKEFLLMLLHPLRCDYLRLNDNYRQIDTVSHDAGGGWHCVRVNP